MTTLDEDLKIASEATGGKWESAIHGDGRYFPRKRTSQMCSYLILQPSGDSGIGSKAYRNNKPNSNYIANFHPEKVKAYIKVAMAAKKLPISFYREPECGTPYCQEAADFIKALEAIENE